MAVSAHIQELETKHHSLDEKIKSELKHPAPDAMALNVMKKQKLMIKEQIQQFKAQ